jgi:hypothetical protein
MNERLNSSPRDIGTSLENGDRIDMHVVSSHLISQEALQHQRQREAVDAEARELMNEIPVQREMGPFERLGAVGVNLAHFRREAKQDDFELVA